MDHLVVEPADGVVAEYGVLGFLIFLVSPARGSEAFLLWDGKNMMKDDGWIASKPMLSTRTQSLRLSINIGSKNSAVLKVLGSITSPLMMARRFLGLVKAGGHALEVFLEVTE